MLYRQNIQRKSKARSASLLIAVFALHLVSGWVNWWHESHHHTDNTQTSDHNKCSHDHTQNPNTSSTASFSVVKDDHDNCLLCDQNWLPVWPSPTFFAQSTSFHFEGIKTDRNTLVYNDTSFGQLSDRAPPVC